LKRNIEKAIKQIPNETYKNIIKGAYERPEKYENIKKPSNRIRPAKNYK
jgi:hypothetical protein